MRTTCPRSYSWFLVELKFELFLQPGPFSLHIVISGNYCKGASLIAQLVKNPPAMQETPVRFLGREDPQEKIGYSLQYSRSSLVAQLLKNLPAVQETWVQSLDWEDPLEKGKATQSSILAGEFQGLYSPWGRKESDATLTKTNYCKLMTTISQALKTISFKQFVVRSMLLTRFPKLRSWSITSLINLTIHNYLIIQVKITDAN